MIRRGMGPLLFGTAGIAFTGLELHAQQEGQQQWRFSVDGYVTYSSPALSPDGQTVYIGVETRTAGRVIAVSALDGGSRWGMQGQGRVLTDSVESSPAVAADGTVYVGGIDGKLYALRPSNGSSIWELGLGGFISSSPAIGSDGTIYVGAGDGRLHALSPQGVQLWTFPAEGAIGPIFSSPAIATDGTIYFGSYDRNVYAVTSGGQEKWRFPTAGTIFSSPAIGRDGTVYVGSSDQRMYAIASDGSKRWDFLTNGPVDASPVLTADGAVCFASGRSFYALHSGDVENRVRWVADINTTSASTAAVRADGTMIFGGDDGIVRALNVSDGSEKWRFDTRSGPGNLIESSPMIAADGSIYIGSQDGALYKINGNGSSLSSQSSWPAFRRNVRHTAVAVPTNTGGQLANIATRAQAGGANNLVAGFVVQGDTPLPYLVRAIGPGLGKVGFSGFMPDPRLDMYSGRQPLHANDNWEDDFSPFGIADTAAGVGAFPLDPGSKDAAIVRPLQSGSFTAEVNSADGAAGVALVEVYDASGGNRTGRILNLSTRAQVGTGQNVLIAGLVVGGTGSLRLLLRGIGPGLAQFGVSGVLARPRIEVFRGNVSLRSNSGWTSDGYKGDLAGAAETVAAFPLLETSADSAMLMDATAGEYTIQITGVGGTTGEAMVEVYVLP